MLYMSRNIACKLPVIITKQNSSFVAYSPALDISTSGHSLKKVKQRFVELSGIFIEEILEAGTINEVLSELGWKKVQKVWNPPQVVANDSVGIQIPVAV